MKYLFSLLLLAPSCVIAQDGSGLEQRTKRTASSALRPAPMHPQAPTAAYVARGGACTFSEDFEGGTMPAGWDIGAQVEQYSDDPENPVPQGTFVDAWAVGTATEANNGGFFEIPDEPAGNQFAYANDDGDPCNCAMENIGLVTPEYDLTGLTGIGLRARIWHDGQYANSTGKVEARVAAGPWTTVFTLAADADWQDIAIVLSDYQGQAAVQFRFQWDDGGGWGTGLAVDDLCITELPANDLAMTGSWLVPDPDVFEDPALRNIEYRNLPLIEAIPLSVSAPVINNGSASQSDVILSVSVDHDGNTYGPFTSAGTVLDPGQRDTLVVETGWTPTAIGEVFVTYTLSSSDPNDAYVDDNTDNQLFNITGPATSDGANAMGCDHGSMDGFIDLAGIVDNASYDALATRFQIEGTGTMVYGAGIAFSDESTVPALFNVYLLDDNGELTSVLDNILETGDLNPPGGSHFKTILFDPPVELAPDMDYELWVENLAEEPIEVGISGVVTPGGMLGHEIGSTQNTIYVGFGNPALMMRLYMSEAVGITEAAGAGATIAGIRPNPVQGPCVVSLQLAQGTSLRCMLVDVNGRVVLQRDLGERGPGTHELPLDLSGLAAGTYDLALLGEGIQAHRKVVVLR